ncbi:hypothetical protein [Geminocystis sp. NIES-3709]|uniref:hypothetical protein n=1 Tax=Geminocystis sp. NIES-3709 TaxID=1617448 RepID=UPI0005FC91FA|nr:hypothetical protein [Geminocystis sp. NIES-3709]BAQ64077.1 hypothetical protein GM3709_842 [Geminocystis sp. NIES-3709]
MMVNQLEKIINLVEKTQEIEININSKPISIQQSKSREKKNLKNKIKNITKQFDFILYEDVQVDIRWLISEQERYEWIHPLMWITLSNQ